MAGPEQREAGGRDRPGGAGPDDAALHVDVHDGDGPFALLVHGLLSSRAQWRPNLEALRRVCRPVVVELLGHGRSAAPEAAEPYTPGAYAAAFEHVRGALGAERWFVVGQSLGAALTLRYALDHPDRVIAQVFTNSSSALADENWQRRTAATAPALARRIEEGGAEALAELPFHPARARRLPDGARDPLVADAGLVRPRAVAQALRHTVPVASVRARVAENRVPTLLVAGTRERGFAEARAFAASAVPRLEVADLDAGHAVNLGAAAAFDAAVGRFLSRHR